MDLRVSTCFVMLTHCFWYGEARNIKAQELLVKNGGEWGVWGKREVCKNGNANGFAMKVEEYQGSAAWHDDTGLNGIRLYCHDGQMITSSVGQWGKWSDPTYCPKGHLISFQLQVEPYQGGVNDDTAANNIRFLCSSGHIVTGHGHEWGNLVHGANLALSVPYVGFRQS